MLHIGQDGSSRLHIHHPDGFILSELIAHDTAKLPDILRKHVVQVEGDETEVSAHCHATAGH
jgi:hypothetical protein